MNTTNHFLFKQFKDTSRIYNLDPKQEHHNENCPIYAYRFRDGWAKYPCYALSTRVVAIENVQKWLKLNVENTPITYNVKLHEAVRVVGTDIRRTVIVSDVKDSMADLVECALTTSQESITNQEKTNPVLLERLRKSAEGLLEFSYFEGDCIKGQSSWKFKTLPVRIMGKVRDITEPFMSIINPKKSEEELESRTYSLMSITFPDSLTGLRFGKTSEDHQHDTILFMCPSHVSMYRRLTKTRELGLLFCDTDWKSPYDAVMFNGDNAVRYFNGVERSPRGYTNMQDSYWPLEDFKARCTLEILGKSKENASRGKLEIKIPSAAIFTLEDFMKKSGYDRKLKHFEKPKCILLATSSSMDLSVKTLRELALQEPPQEIKIHQLTDKLNPGVCISLSERDSDLSEMVYGRKVFGYWIRKQISKRSILIFSGVEEQDTNKLISKLGTEIIPKRQDSHQRNIMAHYSLSFFHLPKYGKGDDYDILLVIKPDVVDMSEMLSSLTHQEYALLPDPKFWTGFGS